MDSFVWDCLFCLLPLILLLLCLVLRWPKIPRWARMAVRAAGWTLWVIICLILRLPLERNTNTEDRSPVLDGSFGSVQVSEVPRLICKRTALAKYLLRHCGSLARPRMASWPSGDPHFQTLLNMLRGQHVKSLQFTRDHLLLRDGGMVALDWAVETRLCEVVGKKRWERKKAHLAGRRALSGSTTMPPVLIVIPQYWGGMTRHLQHLCHQAVRKGYYVVVFHPRSTAGCPLTTPRLTEFGDPADLEQALAYVRSRHPSSVLVAVSEGSGSGILLSYLGESGSSSYLTAAAAISPVLLGQVWFETAAPPVYRWIVTFLRKMQLRRYANSFRGVLDVDQALGCSSIRDFEETLSCLVQRQQNPSSPRSGSHPRPGQAQSAARALSERAHPARDWNQYWERNEPLRDADDVAVPVLCICSLDDPLLPPASTLPLHLFQSNPYFLLALTDRGGHCGFTVDDPQKVLGYRNWSHRAVLEYFRVVEEFLGWGDGDRTRWGDPLVDYSQAGLRSRIRTSASPRRRRTGSMMMRRRRQQTPEESSEDAEEDRFTWKRSNTR